MIWRMTTLMLRGALNSYSLWFAGLLLASALLSPTPRVVWACFGMALLTVAAGTFQRLVDAALVAEGKRLEALQRFREKLEEGLSEYEANICADIVAGQNKWIAEGAKR